MVARTGPSTGNRSSGTAHAVCPSGASTDRYRSLSSNGPGPGADWSVGVMAAVNPVAGSVTGAGEWAARGTTHAACVDHPAGEVSVYTSPDAGIGDFGGGPACAGSGVRCSTSTSSARTRATTAPMTTHRNHAGTAPNRTAARVTGAASVDVPVFPV